MGLMRHKKKAIRLNTRMKMLIIITIFNKVLVK
jgi:hypothetical protein